MNKFQALAVQAIVAALAMGVISWAAWGTSQTVEHTKQIAVHEEELQTTKTMLTEMKVSDLRIEGKIDRLLERSHP